MLQEGRTESDRGRGQAETEGLEGGEITADREIKYIRVYISTR